ncbi:alpha/beta hydrolase fold domain-containing protein [Ditylenchus destructor]|uniref:Alpha/beta hydrolase fold domain-containing protein n=1 Tax=Ditylenchus destructor TaxID=166010 RepID=A0AAD4NFS2_9BILA|nr:alpha/beta hydrolase fold domain-containing protein [Ditylenchus destructor]
MAEIEPVIEDVCEILDSNIGYCRYGHGPTNYLFICGGVGCYKKDYPENVLRAFDPEIATIVCIDPPGYGTSRPPDRQQEVNRCKKDAAYCIALMEKLNLTPFVVLGWSEGGRTAVHVGGQGKTLVTHMILLSTSTKVDFRGDMAFKGMRNTDQWMSAAKEVYLAHYTPEFLKVQWAALCDVVSQVYRDLGGRFPSDFVLPTLKIPVLIINGGMDRFIMDPKLLTEKLANSKVEIHAQGGHDLHIKYSKWFASKITTFIRENPPNKK